MQILKDSDEDKLLYTNFIYSLRTEVTRQKYLTNLKYYMKFLGVTTLRELVEGKPQKIIESDIKAYLVYLRNEKKISYNAAVLYLSAIKKFYIVNTDYPFKWNLINMYLGNDDTDDDDPDLVEDQEGEQEQDRPYTREEIQQMFNAAQDIRVKLVISLMSSTGVRNSVVNSLKLRDLEKIEKYNIYKITAYRKSKKFRYQTFTTPEAANLIDSYLEYRKNHGEQLKGNSPLIREQFPTTDKLRVNNPRHLSARGIRFMINEVLIKYTNLRKKLPFDRVNNRKEGRNPTKLTHAFRKFFHTECAKAGVYPDFIELMLGHKLPGVRGSYMIPDTQTLLEGTKEVKGYVAAIDSLTINEENRLQKQVQDLKEKEDYHTYTIDKKLKEKDQEIEQLKETMKNIFDQINRLKSDLINDKNHPVRIKIKEFLKTKSEQEKTKVEQNKKMFKILEEIERKRKEILSKKGFITKEDEELIDKSILEEIKQTDLNLWKTVFKQK
jgi:integrase